MIHNCGGRATEVLDENTHLRSKMQLNHVQQNVVVFSRFSSWKWFGPFVSRVSKTQMKSQYTSLPPTQPIVAMYLVVVVVVVGGMILCCMR